MEFLPLGEILPELSAKETRMLSILKETDGLPAGNYAFVDSYCSDPQCDCRRVFINVFCVEGELKLQHLATIGYGWETLKFYKQWMHGDAEMAKLMKGIGLEGMQVQSEYAELALEAFHNSIFDERYTERIKGHYAAFKEEIRRLEALDVPLREDGMKVGRNELCPCGSEKKFKKCCG